MSGHQNQIVRIQAVNAGLMILLSVVLVQRFGILGAAAASAIAVAVTNLWSLAAVYRRMKLFPYNCSYTKLLFPGGLTLVTLALLRSLSGHLSWFTAVSGLAVAYVVFFGTFLTCGLEAEDRSLANAVWSGIRQNSRKIGVRYL
jgi:O-antigen/teichoic acid export membrane protein